MLLSGGNFVYPQDAGRFLITGQPILGVNPGPPAKRTPLRPDVPCETQQSPDLHSNPLPAPQGRKVSTSGPGYTQRYAKAQDTAVNWLEKSIKREGLANELKVDPTPITDAAGLSKLPGLGKPGHFKVTDVTKKGASKSR